MNSLVGVLLRFRKAPIAVTADIEAMLCQVRVAPSDKDALRFYWWPNGDLDRIPEIYRMTVHLFGAKSSPSCATFCLRQTAEKFGKYFDPCVAAIELNNFYVDDCLFSIETEEVAISIVNNLRSLLLKGGYKLTKRLSTSSQVMQAIPDEEKSKSVRNAIPPSVPLSCHRILGVSWDVKTDEFYVSVELPKLPCTKRGILSVTNSLYDPLGFVTPVVLNARLVYSEACTEKLGWDEDVQGKLLSRWLSWVEGLPRLQNVRIKRHCRIDFAQNQLHFFPDASNVASGTVCYVHSILPNAIVVCNIVIAKCHIAGSNRNTIPCMELEAALDSIHLSRLVKQELDLHECRCFFRTDSTIVLHSLRADYKRFPIFPRNRLRRILKYSKIFDCNCVPSKLNPADKASRGLTAEDLLRDDVWFSGAGFLKDEPSKWPETIPVASCDDGDIFRSYDLERNVRKCKVANHDTGSETVIVVNVKQTKSAVEDFSQLLNLFCIFPPSTC